MMGARSRTLATALLLGCAAAAAGCGGPQVTERFMQELRREALTSLKLAAAGSTEPDVRSRAIRALGAVAPRETMLWIRQGLHDLDPQVRFTAALALAASGDAAAQTACERLLPDADPLVQAGGLGCLLDRGLTRHREPLLQLLQAQPDLRRRPELMPLLQRLCDRATTVELQAWWSAAEPDDYIFNAAVRAALVKKGDPAMTRQVLLEARTAGPQQQIAATEMLALSADPKVLYILLDRLENGPTLLCRLAAARALGKFESPKGLGLAMACLADPRAGAGPSAGTAERILACQACAAIRDPQALLPLSRLFRAETSAAVRIACAAAILSLTAGDKDIVS